MTGRRHRSNCELSAQGVANIVSVIFGGMCVTGTVARTATNVRAGARGPVSGIFHCAYLLMFLIVAAPLVGFIPLAALGAVLAMVAWNMAEKEEFWSLLRSSRGDAVVLLATFLLTIFVDLITGIAVGVVFGALLFLHRMAEAVEVDGERASLDDIADSTDEQRYDAGQVSNRDFMVYRISGAFFFGATARVLTVLERVGTPPRLLVLDFRDVPLIDSTAARSLVAFVRKLTRSGTEVNFATAARSLCLRSQAQALGNRSQSGKTQCAADIKSRRTQTAARALFGQFNRSSQSWLQGWPQGRLKTQTAARALFGQFNRSSQSWLQGRPQGRLKKTLRIDIDLQPHIAARFGRAAKPFAQIGG